MTPNGARAGDAPPVVPSSGGPRSVLFLLEHRHRPRECGVAFAAFKGHRSPLRDEPAVASCLSGGHAIWWLVEAPSAADALARLPHFVAERTTVTEVREVRIP